MGASYQCAIIASEPHMIGRIDIEQRVREWNNMLAHQLPALSPFDEFWNQLPDVFAWLQSED